MMKMKNKKLLTRLFALLASLVLVFALALPCFADEPEENSELCIRKQIVFTDRPSLYSWMLENASKVDRVVLSDATGALTNSFSAFTNHNDVFQFYEFKTYYSSSSDVSYVLTPTFTLIELSNTEVRIFERVPFTGGENVGLDYSIPDELWSEIGLFATVEYVLEEPTEDGWYIQIQNIIKDAVFGDAVLLNDSQEFILNQISLWLTLIVLLLPFVVVAVIVVRCFR